MKSLVFVFIIFLAQISQANHCRNSLFSSKDRSTTKMNKFKSIFGTENPIIGMIHLAPGGNISRVEKALREISIMEENGVDAIIVENYHGEIQHVEEVLRVLKRRKNKTVVGLNILPNEYEIAFPMARKYGVKFIQFDFVAGSYAQSWGGGDYIIELDSEHYMSYRNKYKEIGVIGGVHPKYYNPVKGSVLKNDLSDAVQRADAIVVTGSGTGMETPLKKIIAFRKILGPNIPLVVGAGVDLDNAETQLLIGNGAIVGSYFKDGDTTSGLQPDRVSGFMAVVRLVLKLKSLM